MKKEYHPKEIEQTWQQTWEEQGVFKQYNRQKNYYVLDMFPYPSGAGLHVGHPKGYIATDVVSRFKLLNGYSVLHPMGWDAFGLPAENYAIKMKMHPRVAVEQNIATFKQQLQLFGFTYDWDREVNTTDPEYYKWTQWIFLQLFEKGLAYESNESVNWCPSCKTVLSNEDLEQGRCERCGSEVLQRKMRQWVLKMTAYADRLLYDLDNSELDWEDSIIQQQKNWIGRSEGIDIEYEIEGTDQKITVYTTRPDTNFGATFIVVAPDSTFVEKQKDLFPNKDAVLRYIEETNKKTELERISEGKKKTGVPTGLYAINNLNQRRMPIYVGDFVLATVGTGAVVGVPGHDLRDFEFAQAMGLDIIRVVVGADGDTSHITKAEQVQEEEGVMINSDFLDGLQIQDAKEKIKDYIEAKGFGKRKVNYKMRDWVFSRQKYWGEPIPIVHCKKCGTVAVPEDQLPIMLPEVESYEPTKTGESPLANIEQWVNTTCPTCGEAAKRETNTMPQWAGSSWYYLRYIDPKNTRKLVDEQKEKKWMPVDLYVGGAEHATRHLLYARFWHKFLFDLGVVSITEPFQRLVHVGLILAEDGRKMSKRWNNVINPDDIIDQFGADAMRVYEMFMGPFTQNIAWSTNGVSGVRRFLNRVWDIAYSHKDILVVQNKSKLIHKTIKGVTDDIKYFRFNVAISKLMVFINERDFGSKIDKYGRLEGNEFDKEAFEKFLIILSPFAPHIAEELWKNLGHTSSILQEQWPTWDETMIIADIVTMAVQVNGKMRGTIEISPNASEEEAKAAALKQESVQRHLEGKSIIKLIYVPGKILNIVVK